MMEQSAQSPTLLFLTSNTVLRPIAGRKCLSYPDADALIREVEAVSEDRYDLQRGALDWTRVNSTRRTGELLREMGFPRS
jgi:hypothetical protein